MSLTMSWVILVLSGAFEAVWAIALDRSDGFTRLVPSVVFFAALLVSMGGLAVALKQLPVGTAYAVWVGIGASIAIVWSFATGQETFTLLKALFLAMILGGIVGLKLVN